jgi:hypothetical protein
MFIVAQPGAPPPRQSKFFFKFSTFEWSIVNSGLYKSPELTKYMMCMLMRYGVLTSFSLLPIMCIFAVYIGSIGATGVS